jgi:hypothetical protein
MANERYNLTDLFTTLEFENISRLLLNAPAHSDHGLRYILGQDRPKDLKMGHNCYET